MNDKSKTINQGLILGSRDYLFFKLLQTGDRVSILDLERIVKDRNVRYRCMKKRRLGVKIHTIRILFKNIAGIKTRVGYYQLDASELKMVRRHVDDYEKGNGTEKATVVAPNECLSIQDQLPQSGAVQ